MPVVEQSGPQAAECRASVPGRLVPAQEGHGMAPVVGQRALALKLPPVSVPAPEAYVPMEPL